MGKSVVSIVRTGESERAEVAAAVRKAVEMAGGFGDKIKPGALVLLKPNVVCKPTGLRTGGTTNPDVVRAVADMVKELGARPVIAESSAVGVDTELAYKHSGYYELREDDYEVVDLKTQPKVKIKVPDGKGKLLENVTSFEMVPKVDAIISLPVMKTHDQTEVTLSLKNLKGLLDDTEKKRLHRRGVFRGVIDMVSALQPAFTVIDGTYCQEGLGPIFGHTVQMNLVMASRDLVAADAVAGHVMGYTPDEVLTTKYAAERGLGNASLDQIEVVGETIEAVKRRFLRSVEDHQYDVKGLRIIHAEGTCTGCRNTVVSCLYDLKNADQLGLAEGLNILTSNAEIPADCDPSKLITVGNCVPPKRRGEKFAPGCPPNNVWIVQLVVGDRGTVRRAYATSDATTD